MSVTYITYWIHLVLLVCKCVRADHLELGSISGSLLLKKKYSPSLRTTNFYRSSSSVMHFKIIPVTMVCHQLLSSCTKWGTQDPKGKVPPVHSYYWIKYPNLSIWSKWTRHVNRKRTCGKKWEILEERK